MHYFISLLGCLAVGALAVGSLGACSGSSKSSSDEGKDGGGAGDAGHDATPASGLDGMQPSDASVSETSLADGPFVEAVHAPFPQVAYQGGGIITAPQLVTVTFPGDPLASQFVTFGQGIESSSWWTTVTGGYCETGGTPCVGVGSAPIAVPYPTAPASSYTDSDQGGASTLQEWLVDAFQSDTLPAPQAGAISNTLYLLYFPTTTTVEYDGMQSCQSFDGYHGSVTYNGAQVPYAVINECSGASAGEMPPITTLENTTITASHEIIEASTDPSNLALGYYMSFDVLDNFGWLDVEGGEVADLCVDPFLLAQDEWPESSFLVQRIWSNTNAMAGLDPCAPIPTGEVYFSGSPVQSFFVMDVGSTLTFEVDAFSTGPRADWTLAAQDWTGSSSAYLTFTIEGGTGDPTLGSVIQVNNGSK
jgi:hypothetical protein